MKKWPIVVFGAVLTFGALVAVPAPTSATKTEWFVDDAKLPFDARDPRDGLPGRTVRCRLPHRGARRLER